MSSESPQTGPRDTSETKSKKRVFALFSMLGVWGSLLLTHTPRHTAGYNIRLYVCHAYSLFSLEKVWLCKLFLKTHYYRWPMQSTGAMHPCGRTEGGSSSSSVVP